MLILRLKSREKFILLMFDYAEFKFWWLVFEVLNGLVVSALAGAMIYMLFKHRKDKSPIVAWSNDLKKSKRGMNYLIIAAFLFILMFLIYYLSKQDANAIQGEVLNVTSKLLGSAVYLLVSFVVFSWFKVFRRFAWRS